MFSYLVPSCSNVRGFLCYLHKSQKIIVKYITIHLFYNTTSVIFDYTNKENHYDNP